MIRFEREELIIPLHEEGGVREARVELRRDPLSGEQCRITPRRPPSGFRANARLDTPPTEKGPCPLCPEHVDELTPRLDAAHFDEPRLRLGEAVLFPNRYPYGRWSAVLALTRAHLVGLEAYTQAHYVDGLGLARTYAMRLLDAGEGPFVGVTQNHLPTSGGTLIHPHLQVHVDAQPATVFQRVRGGLEDYRRRSGRAFFDDLIREEERLGERFVRWQGDLALLVPFAPRGFAEVWLVYPRLRSLRELDDAHADTLAREIRRVLAFYHHLGWNAFNLSLTSIEAPGSDHPLWCRMMLRGRFGPFARSDVSFHEKLYEEMSISLAPELTAEHLRAFLDD